MMKVNPYELLDQLLKIKGVKRLRSYREGAGTRMMVNPCEQ